jgi:metal-responsive CopG/Arc/MetJ family transcriptional regulator
MASRNYTISMPEEIMAMVDAMAQREHRSRSEMLREMVREEAARRKAAEGDVLGALHDLFAPFREATADMTDEEFDALVRTSIREVRDEKRRAGHERAGAGGRATTKPVRQDTAAVR